MSSKVPKASTTAPPQSGLRHLGTANCVASCVCAVGTEAVWAADRSGSLTVLSSRTAEPTAVIDPPPSGPLHVLAMAHTAVGEVWCGTRDGRLVVYDASSRAVVAELKDPELERPGDVLCLAVDGANVYAGLQGARVSQWDVRTKEFVGAVEHSAAVNAVLSVGGACYTGDDDGNVSVFDCETGDVMEQVRARASGVTAMALDPVESQLWCGHADGTVTIFRTDAGLEVTATIGDAKKRLNSLVYVGGKMVAAGEERTLFTWEATTRALVSSVKDHAAFIFSLTKLASLETARLWSLSNDKTVRAYDCEGFFNVVRGVGLESEALVESKVQLRALHRRVKTLERAVELEGDKMRAKQEELDDSRVAVTKWQLKVNELECLLDKQTESIQGGALNYQKLFQENSGLRSKIDEQARMLQKLEEDKLQLNAAVLREQQQAARMRDEAAAKITAVAAEAAAREAVDKDRERLQAAVRVANAETEKLAGELRQLKAELISKDMEIGRQKSLVTAADDRRRSAEEASRVAEEKRLVAERATRTANDLLMVRDHERKALLEDLAKLRSENGATADELKALRRAQLERENAAKELTDDHLLQKHELSHSKADAEKLEQQLLRERELGLDARSSETRLKLQVEELRRQLERERQAVKQLEDQYTIFQFVINSRGELISHLWNLHDKVTGAGKALRQLDGGVKQVDPTKDKVTLRHQWQTHVVKRSVAGVEAVQELQQRLDYIIANYLSEYEKMHLGISTAQYVADTKRSPVVGEKLLTKLRDVTLLKQFSHTPKSSLPRPASAHGARLTADFITGAENSAASVRPSTSLARVSHVSAPLSHSVRPLE